MSLKSIKLDPLLIAGLYQQHLIPHKSEKNQPEKQDKKRDYLGNNQQNILILIHNQKETFLSENLYAFLTQILKACSLSMNDIALINRANHSENELKQLMQQLTPDKVILFSHLIPEVFPDNHPRNQPWETSGRQYLYTDPLEDLYTNKELKVAFWKALQEIFSMKS